MFATWYTLTLNRTNERSDLTDMATWYTFIQRMWRIYSLLLVFLRLIRTKDWGSVGPPYRYFEAPTREIMVLGMGRTPVNSDIIQVRALVLWIFSPSNKPSGTIPRTLMKGGQCPQSSSGLCSLLIYSTKKSAHYDPTPLWNREPGIGA